MTWLIVYLIVTATLSVLISLMAIGNKEGSLLYRTLTIWKDATDFWGVVKSILILLIMFALTPWLVITSLIYILYCGD